MIAFLTSATSGDVLEVADGVVSKGIDWIGDFIGAVSSSPILMTFVVGVPLVGLGVGLLKRLISTRG